jgi:short-subunit dehydrogenase
MMIQPVFDPAFCAWPLLPSAFPRWFSCQRTMPALFLNYQQSRKGHSLMSTEPFEFGGTTSMVTGASSGIGAEFARQLAARGSNLVLVARSADRLETLANELRTAHGVNVTSLAADLSRPDEVGCVIAFIDSTPVDVLVNNAGTGTYGSFAELEAAREHAEVMLNVAAAVDLAHAALPGMLSRHSGGIITVASVAGFQASPLQAVYGATKAFALAFSEALWEETRESGVRIVALCPGATATEFFSNLGDDRATSSLAFRHPTNAASVVRQALLGFDHDAMTVVPGSANWLMAQVHRFVPRTTMVRLARRALAPTMQMKTRQPNARQASVPH